MTARRNTTTRILKAIMESPAERTFEVTARVGRGTRGFVCNGKSELSARRQAMKYYREVYPERVTQIVSVKEL